MSQSSYSRVPLLVLLTAVAFMVVVNRFATNSASASEGENTASVETVRASLAPACPTSFTVNDNGDAADATPGDESCATAGAVCTLRAAIQEANALASCGVIDINFSGVTSPISLNAALPVLNHSININGPGADLLTVQRSTAGGTPQFSIFRTAGTLTINISGLTISGGIAALGEDGGGIFIQNNTTLTFTGVKISGNRTADAVLIRAGFGAGIYNRGILQIINSTVSGNITGQGSSDVPDGGDGGGIYNASIGVLTVTNATISGNKTGNGSPFSGQDGDGGGIFNLGGSVTLVNTTISGNTTGTSVVTGGGSGAGIRSPSGQLKLTNCTVTNNVASSNSGGSSIGGVGVGGTPATLRNTIIANNSAVSSPDVSGTFNSLDYNLIENVTNGTFIGTTTHNITGIDPLLGPLQDNGGPTQTHAPQTGSPAIDSANNCVFDNTCSPSLGASITTDQRGGTFTRNADGDGNGSMVVDIGAFEVQQAPAPPLSISNVSPRAGRTSGGQQIQLTGAFANLSTVTMGGVSATWSYTNGAGDTSAITVTTPAHALGAVQIDLTPTSGSPYSKPNAFAYLPTVFTDDTIVVGQTTVKAQHIIELRQAVDALHAVAGLSAATWTDPTPSPTTTIIKAAHIVELRTYLDEAATELGYSTSPYTDPSLSAGSVIKRIHIEELRQHIRNIAG